MTVAYLDTSALVKLVIEEPGRDAVVQLWDGADAVVTSPLAHPEVTGAIATAHRTGRLGVDGAARAYEDWDRYRVGLRYLELSSTVANLAADLNRRHPLSGADAVHLASALQLLDGPLVLATFDARLHAAAQSNDIVTLPANL